MRVLFLTKYYPPSEGGIERYGHLLCTGLASCGIEVDVVAFAEDRLAAPPCVMDGVAVYRLPRHLNPGHAPFSLALPGLVRRLAPRCDLVHLNFPNPCIKGRHIPAHDIPVAQPIDASACRRQLQTCCPFDRAPLARCHPW